MKIRDKITPIVHFKKIPVIGIGSDGNNAIKILGKEHLMNFSPQTILPKVKKDNNDLMPLRLKNPQTQFCFFIVRGYILMKEPKMKRQKSSFRKTVAVQPEC